MYTLYWFFLVQYSYNTCVFRQSFYNLFLLMIVRYFQINLNWFLLNWLGSSEIRLICSSEPNNVLMLFSFHILQITVSFEIILITCYKTIKSQLCTTCKKKKEKGKERDGQERRNWIYFQREGNKSGDTNKKKLLGIHSVLLVSGCYCVGQKCKFAKEKKKKSPVNRTYYWMNV